jgi:hypothetical protein
MAGTLLLLPGLLFLIPDIFAHLHPLRLTQYKMKKFEDLKTMIASLEDDMDKFYNKQNGAAGTRVRKAMQDLKTLAQEIRTEVQETKNKEA